MPMEGAGLGVRLIAAKLSLCLCAVLGLMLAGPVSVLSAGMAQAQSAFASPGETADPRGDFAAYVRSLWPKAESAGISVETFNAAFAGVVPDERILAKRSAQPELERPVWEYLEQIVNEKRYTMGVAALQQESGLLDAIEATYGVPRDVLVAVWGIESLYGTNTGPFSVIRSLATLGWSKGHRARFAEQQLIAALKILQHGDVSPDKLTGSWAGAMGHTQFIPTTYLAYAVDFDKDGRRDIWSSNVDALASAAHYLKANGWHAGEPWGYEVKLPRGFDYTQAGLATKKTVAAWRDLNVSRVDGGKLASSTLKGSILLPAGARGPALLVLGNFRALLHYNNAESYGLAVGWLAARLSDKTFLVTPWPKDLRPLQKAERQEMQRLLISRGYAISHADGTVRAETRAAVRAYQHSKGLPEDGFPTEDLLEELRADART